MCILIGLKDVEEILRKLWRGNCLVGLLPQEEDVTDDPWGLDIDDVGFDEPEDPWDLGLEEEEPDPGTEDAYLDVQWLPLSFFDNMNRTQARILGLDNSVEEIFAAPTPVLETLDCVLQRGDRLVWEDRLFKVRDILRRGRWRDTDRYLMCVLVVDELENSDASTDSE